MALLGRRKKSKPAKTGPSRRERLAQIKLAFSMTRKSDSKMLPLVLGAFVITLAVFVVIGAWAGHPVYLSVIGVLFALVVAVAVFGRRVQRAAYSQVEGQMGAAAAVLQNMRGNWRVTPAVQFNKDQDMVHRVVGRPGVVLVAEGNHNRTRGLVVNEKRALSRLVGETPIYDVYVGDGEGQVSLRELEKHFTRLPRNIKPALVNQLDGRLKAIRASGGSLPIPKGPMPTRVPRGKVR
jgi:hypothetical protein